MIIDVQNLTKCYHPYGAVVNALQGISLSVDTGDFVAVRGVSGCGKSTLMHVLGLLAGSYSGTYRFCGVDVHLGSDDERAVIRNRMIGFIFQQFHLLPRVSVLDNVAIPAVYRRGRPDLRRAMECLDAVGISDLSRRYPNQLSGGQQQRVAIARALMHEPPLLLADEPTGNLDSESADYVLETLERLHQGGTTLVLVTHEPSVAERARRQIVMRDGRVISDTATTGAMTEKTDKIQPSSFAVVTDHSPRLQHMFRTYLQQASFALKAHIPRTSLSALGILVGTFSLMMTMLLIAGAKESIRLQMEGLGTNLMIVTPQADRADDGASPRLTLADANEASAVPGIQALAGTVMGLAELSIDGGRKQTTPVVGAEASFANLTPNHPTSGRFFSDAEVERSARVVLLGATPARAFFGEKNPVGRTISINGLLFRIIGIMPERGVNPWRDPDDIAVLPVTTAMRSVLGRQDLDQMQLELTHPDQMRNAEKAIRALLSRRHPGIASRGDAFRFRNMSRIRETFEDITSILSGLLMSVSVLSLLVGGIGIMNIMMVAVTERTREVGLRKALGAQVKDIMAQFLVEAVLLSMSGGAVGVGLGFAVLSLTGGMGVPLAWAWTAAALAFMAAGITGMIFGVWPAWIAAKRDPVESLRHE